MSFSLPSSSHQTPTGERLPGCGRPGRTAGSHRQSPAAQAGLARSRVLGQGLHHYVLPKDDPMAALNILRVIAAGR